MLVNLILNPDLSIEPFDLNVTVAMLKSDVSLYPLAHNFLYVSAPK